MNKNLRIVKGNVEWHRTRRMSNEVMDAMCKRILKHVVDLVGVEFLDEEIKYWKGVEGMKGEGCVNIWERFGNI